MSADPFRHTAGNLVEVGDLASALAALEEIVEQGEGTARGGVWDGDQDVFHPERQEVGHYYRFQELKLGRRYQRGDTPQSGPTGEAIQVNLTGVPPMRRNPRLSDHEPGSAIHAPGHYGRRRSPRSEVVRSPPGGLFPTSARGSPVVIGCAARRCNERMAFTPAVTAERLTKTFATGTGRIEVLKGITTVIPAGAMTAVVGPSGCGKSTLLFCLAGLETPTTGTVTVLGDDLGQSRAGDVARLYRDRIGFMFQTYNLIPSLTARENVVLPQRLARKPADLAAAGCLLAEVGLTARHDTGAAKLSSGEQQRVALARVLAKDPSVVFADEPTGALDTVTAALVLRRLRALADGSRTVVMVTHDLDAAGQADHVLVMRDGLVTHALDRPTAGELLQIMSRSPQGIAS
ncbi:ATP-binding cassette domain-containing protein [Nonomuraea sp. NPDC003707]